MKRKISATILILCCILLGFTVSAQGKESIPVSCYVGDPANNQEVGDLETFNVANAARLCNTVYYDCDGRCTACYINEEEMTVCIDSGGRKYTK
jgi:hypothetical protein